MSRRPDRRGGQSAAYAAHTQRPESYEKRLHNSSYGEEVTRLLIRRRGDSSYVEPASYEKRFPNSSYAASYERSFPDAASYERGFPDSSYSEPCV